ncbi:hypothetical protein Poli38472_012017 [Pythium oligandrum]|uniref:Eukaryotic translation initiation factor 3 subunit G n=1 Tax=Pythium oligandrum TaxID=41045 RepID=A0A8K1FL94_PYTOL|nr:hypothetical protein Poli38472_012017 [Pythium oligandrum]|eukprot:TMW66901.1 hypothetical protein Poli38472_012017 [Pythium oligandrum]
MEVTGWREEEDAALPPRTESGPDADGVRTIVEWKYNEAGDMVQVITKVKKVRQVEEVNADVLERKKWAKFGAAANDEDKSNVTYPSYEEITIEDPYAEQDNEPELVRLLETNVVCRICGMTGGHWTSQCPQKDKATNDASVNESDGTSGKYVPPWQRGRGGTDSAQESDNSTIRVINILPSTKEDALKKLFGVCGPVTRVYIPKDRETSQPRGFAFVSFTSREHAQQALEKFQGYSYDNSVFKIDWAKSSNKSGGDQDPGSMNTTYRSGYGKALPQTQK